MKQKLTPIIFILALSLKIAGQTNYKKGFIIDSKGDTINGLLKNENLIESSQKCMFMKSSDSKVICYSPDSIKGYKFLNGKFFVSKLIIIGKELKPSFLEYLLDGRLSLYFRMDENGEHFYIQKENDNILELLNSKTTIYKGETQYIRQLNEYIGMMKYLMTDCPEIQPEIDKSTFEANSLVTLTKDYHNYVCKDHACTIYEKEMKIRTSIGCLIGVYNSQIVFSINDEAFAFLRGEKFINTTTYSSGLLISMNNMFGIDDNYQFNFLIGFKNSLYQSEHFKISQQNLYLPIYMSYYFQTGKFRPLLNLGLVNKFYLNTDVKNSDIVKSSLVKQSIGLYEFDGLLGGGIEFKRKKLSLLLNFNLEFNPAGINKIGTVSLNRLSSSCFDYGIVFGMKYDLF